MAKSSAGLRSKESEEIAFQKHEVLQVLWNDWYWISSIPMISVLVFIVGLIRIASMSLAVLYKEIYFRESASTSEMNQLIMKWRKSYILVRDLVAEMNACFGQQIIIVVFITIISSINLTFVVIVKIRTSDSSFLIEYILEIVTNIICLCLLAFISEQIPQQVSYKYNC